ncbi:MAG: carboxypeptidase regulatory-like domain-containing protein [Elusimicrobiota bacterium]
MPYINFNLRGNNNFILISGDEVDKSGWYGFYWNGSEWIHDSSLVNGLERHAWTEAPAFDYNVTGNNKWILICHAKDSNWYGYYWNGIKWIEDNTLVEGLDNISGETSHVFLDNLQGEGKQTLITGTKEGSFRAYYWDITTEQWIEDNSRATGLENRSQGRITAAFNIFGNNQWNCITGSSGGQQLYAYYWNGSQWIRDESNEAGLWSDFNETSPTVAHNIRGDNKWILISGIAKQRDSLGFLYDSVDASNLTEPQNVNSYQPLATTVHITFSYPRTWNYRIKYSQNADMSNVQWSDWINDVDDVDYKLKNLQPNTTYYYQVYAYVPWDTSYYSTSEIKSFQTISSQNHVFVNPGESIQEAIETLPLEGGTVELAGGVHNTDYQIWIWTDNVTFIGQGIDKTIIEGNLEDNKIIVGKYENPSERQAWMYDHLIKGETFHNYSEENPEDFIHNTEIRDFSIHNFTSDSGHGIFVIQGWNVTISDVKVYLDKFASHCNGVRFSYTRDSIVKNSFFENVTKGIMFWAPEKNDAINNTIYNAFEGIEYNGSWTFGDPVIVKGNKVNGTRAAGIYLYSSSDIIAEENIVENAGSYKGVRAGIELNLGGGLEVKNNILKNNWNGISSRSKNQTGDNSRNHKIFNNIVYQNENHGILIDDTLNNEASQRAYVYSNTIAGNGSDGVHNIENHILYLKNNIITNNTGYGINGGENTSSVYNNYFGNVSADYNNISAGTGDISVNPLFVDPANGDFHLKPNSPCIDAGDPSETDPDGTRINMGAYGGTAEAAKAENPTGIISGKITDIKTNQPIEEATVTVEGTGKYGKTASNGVYTISGIPVGNCSVTASKPGYNSNSKNADVFQDQTTSVNLQLLWIGSHNKSIVYPNPYIKGKNKAEKIVFTNLPKNSTLSIYNISGELVEKIIHDSQIDRGTQQWNISGVASGVYIYSIVSPEVNRKGKVSVIK